MAAWLEQMLGGQAEPPAGFESAGRGEFADEDRAPCRICADQRHGALRCRICGLYYCGVASVQEVGVTLAGQPWILRVHRPCVRRFLEAARRNRRMKLQFIESRGMYLTLGPGGAAPPEPER